MAAATAAATSILPVDKAEEVFPCGGDERLIRQRTNIFLPIDVRWTREHRTVHDHELQPVSQPFLP
jgi:hypothetical protein